MWWKKLIVFSGDPQTDTYISIFIVVVMLALTMCLDCKDRRNFFIDLIEILTLAGVVYGLVAVGFNLSWWL